MLPLQVDNAIHRPIAHAKHGCRMPQFSLLGQW